MSQNKIQLLQNAIEENPKDPFPHYALAKAYEKSEMYSDAQSQYDHLVRHFPEYGGTYYHYVLLLIHKEKLEKAKMICDQGLEVLQKAGDRQLYNELLMLREQELEDY